MGIFEIPESNIFNAIFNFDHIEVDIKTVAASETGEYKR